MRWQVELEGFPTAVFGPEDGAVCRETAWDCYKRRYGDRVRRTRHDKTPVITRLEDAPERKGD